LHEHSPDIYAAAGIIIPHDPSTKKGQLVGADAQGQPGRSLTEDGPAVSVLADR
jgi:hypothetical protein